MADKTPATRKATFTNRGIGPRSLVDSDGVTQTVAPGSSYAGEFREADLDGISSDFVEGDGDEGEDNLAERTEPFAPGVALDGLSKDQLLAVATTEGLSTLTNAASEDDLRDAIQASRDAHADAAKPAKADKKPTA